MINFKVLDEKDCQIKKEILEQNALEKFSQYDLVVAKENNQVLGMAFYETGSQFCKIEKLYMVHEDPLVKDGLIRVLINAMDLRGIKLIIAKNESEDSFFCSFGFYPLFFPQNMIDLDIEPSEYRMLYTEEFFNNTCCKGK